MLFQRSCIYGKNGSMRVIEADNEAEYRRLLDSGVWFDHPLKAKEIKEDNHAKQIRQHPRKRRVDGKHSAESI
jgi:hypothetical protein